LSEKPLHVRVAEALGWTGIKPWPEAMSADALGGHPPGEPRGWNHVPRYDTDWSAAGPLIERFSLSVHPDLSLTGEPRNQWSATRLVAAGEVHESEDFFHVMSASVIAGDGVTPLEAVCRAVLALHAAGKLS
jgi:hypothetical protein